MHTRTNSKEQKLHNKKKEEEKVSSRLKNSIWKSFIQFSESIDRLCKKVKGNHQSNSHAISPWLVN